MIKIANISTGINRGRGGTYYLAVRSDFIDPQQLIEFNKIMSSFNYRAFPRTSKNPAWTKQIIPTNIDEVRAELDIVAKQFSSPIDYSGLIQIEESFASISNTDGNKTEATDTIESFIEKLRTEKQTTPAAEQSKMMMDLIEQQLENLANSVDEAKKNAFIVSFLEFSSKFWKYSFSNQMLIFLQTQGKATYVRGKKQWEGMGRKVKFDATPISILAPEMRKNEVDVNAIRAILYFIQRFISDNPQELDLTNSNNIRKFLGFAKRSLAGKRYYYLYNLYKIKRYKNVLEIESYLENLESQDKGDNITSNLGFKGVEVYDYNDTTPISDYEEKTGKKPFEMLPNDVWQSKYNTDDAKTSSILKAALSFAASNKIDIDLTEDTGRSGGYSAGDKIAINYQSKGQRQLSTIFHEIAHSLLHFDNNRLKNTDTSQEREIDAESVAYILMKHFGFDADGYAPNYLALHGAGSKDIKARRDNIAKAVKQILTGLHEQLLGKGVEAKNRNWFKLAKKNTFVFGETFLPLVYRIDA